MLRKTDYFKLGSYIIVGTCLLLGVVIVLGAGRYFKTTFTIETYFDESVNGLEIGSPVKLRGVRIGRVADIDFVANIYKKAKEKERRYVYVVCDIDPEMFGDMNKQEFKEDTAREVKQGLRVRPTTLGLTGQLFLNLVFDKSDSGKPLQIEWSPADAYIPSVPSTLSRIEAAVTTISNTLSGLDKEDISSIIKDIKSIVATIDDFMKTDGGKKTASHLLGVLDQTKKLLARTNELMANPALDGLMTDAASAVSGIDTIVNESSEDLIAAVHEARQAITSFKKASDVVAKLLNDPRMDEAMSEIAPTLQNVADASTDLTASVRKVHALINRLNAVVASEEANVHAILEDTREVMENLKELSGDAKRYPSGVFFGKPPSKATPDTRK
jgi:paraquat-inducible protein B